MSDNTTKKSTGTTAKAPTKEQIEAEADAKRRRDAEEAEADAQRMLAEEEAKAKANAITQAEAAEAQQAEAEKDGDLKALEDVLGHEVEPITSIPETLFVEDLTAQSYDHPRVHTHIIGGHEKDFEFFKGKKNEMPFAHACRFLIDPAFVVRDADGNVFKPSPKRISTTDITSLRADQVIADIRELTNDALYLRAMKFPGGESLNRSMAREEIVEFLIAAHEAVDTAPGGGREAMFSDGDGRYEDMEDAAVGRLLGTAA